jgi:tetratricopeptide (TPR) repeat protein
MHKALDYFQQAIDRDPSFALAYSGIADTYALICSPEVAGDMPANEALPKAKAAALKALEIDNTLAEPHVSLGHVAFYYDRDWPAAEREFKRAIEMNPNYSVAHHWYSIYLSASGRHTEALAEIRRALELDPLSLPINVWLGRILIDSGAVDQGIEHLRKTIEMDPNFIQARYRLGSAYESKGLYDDAISEFIEARKLPGGNLGSLAALAHAYAITGRREQAEKILQEVLRLSKQSYVSPTQIASIYVALGDKDEAFRWLDEAEKSHDLGTVRLKQDTRFIAVRSDPRFDDIVRRVGIP